ncbi:Hint domain-containing protein [Cribrihabitans marinus]|uniref:Hint domain-containing protein n=1 Tax=Cribrihabitans marinus TaxID=1227549 RepID=A0A1H6QU07_9RHOB|nr:Hint domain-containing protein [Cribrihabitans marinus]GGH19250.1 hypothetical protein GCM10010973_02510 [Cribrihabitans marinus]SEI44414.1 Hint domain-containing protein [Cribrihabitans marinus]
MTSCDNPIPAWVVDVLVTGPVSDGAGALSDEVAAQHPGVVGDVDVAVDGVQLLHPDVDEGGGDPDNPGRGTVVAAFRVKDDDKGLPLVQGDGHGAGAATNRIRVRPDGAVEVEHRDGENVAVLTTSAGFALAGDAVTVRIGWSAAQGVAVKAENGSNRRDETVFLAHDAVGPATISARGGPAAGLVPCFTPGILIATPRGEKPVEELRAGDRVVTRDNGLQPIRWYDEIRLGRADLIRAEHLRPIRIRAGALGGGLPERDMTVSPNHRILVSNDKTALYFEDREVLVAAKHLVGLEGVEAVDLFDVTYIHFMFDRHEVVLSNGAWSESFQPEIQALAGLGNAQRTEIFELFPELRSAHGQAAFAPARRSLTKREARLLMN